MKKLLLFTLLVFWVSVNSQEISTNDKDALLALYNATDGVNWTNKWDLNEDPENWYGVKTSVVFGASGAERHIDEINLSDNNLIGILPANLGNLKSLNTLNLSNNALSGTIPGGLGNAKDLNYLYLQNNELSGDIPTDLFTLNDRHFVEINLSSNKLTGKLPVEIGNAIANTGDVYVSNNLLTDLPNYTNISLFRINTLDISNNNINFSVLERVPSFDNIAKVLEDNVATLTYSPQNKINEVETIELNVGANVSFSITGLISTNNTYQWYKDGVAIGGATNTTYQITGTTLADVGTYYCEVKNTNVPNISLQRNTIILNTIGAINDRNALIALYNATDGPNWKDTWDLNGGISSWEGITVNTVGRVTELNHSYRKLNGTLPDDIGNLTELTNLTLIGFDSTKNLIGSIPNTICNLTKLENIKIRQLDLTGAIPSCLFNITSLKKVSIQGQGYYSRFTLDLPNDLSNLTNLTQLSLQYVELSSKSGVPLSSLVNLTDLALDEVDLSSEGGFPMSILKLSNLENLKLDGNKIYGNIPPEISNLTKLQEFYIARNNIVGSIPVEIGLLSNLKSLTFNGIPLTGVIPSSIGDLVSLDGLTIFRTNIEGEIPSSLSKLTSLRYLEIYGNKKLTGQIPSSINTISTLESLDLGNNSLFGAIPDFTGLAGLFELNLSQNKFVFQDLENEHTSYKNNPKLSSRYTYQPQSNIDTKKIIELIEEELFTLTAETTQSINNTYQWRKDGVDITGAINRTYTINNIVLSDEGVYDCVIKNSIITDLTLIKNQVTLKVESKDAIHDKNALITFYNATDGPNWIDSWDLNADISTWKGVTVNTVGRVTELIHSYRKLNGTLPDDIGKLTELTKLTLNGGLTGSIPNTICNLTKLESINIGGTDMEGAIPSCLFNIASLRSVKIFGNYSNGKVLTLDLPNDLSNLTNLTSLSLSLVDLSSEGEFPTSILQLTNLESLDLYSNRLTGDIPAEISNLTKLENLSISNNSNITGEIPKEIGQLSNLINLSFSGLSLKGEIPSSIGQLSNLTSLSFSGLSLKGEIPSSIGNLIKLQYLQLSRSNIEGEIPSSFSKLDLLSSLNLSENKFTGKIPTFINTFSNLRYLDLESNNFSGNIPNLTSLTSLESLSIGYNKFVFEDFENEFTTYNTLPGWFSYKPQLNIDAAQTITVNEEESITLTVEETQSTNNTYQWRKDGIDITGATNNLYTINNVKFEDKGVYDCVINNDIVTDLVLIKNEIVLNVELLDSDNDGVNNDVDLCANTPSGETVNSEGCSQSQIDDDNDGVFNNLDICANTPSGKTVNSEGCSQSQIDDDNDGVFNNLDICANTPLGEIVNSEGCSQSQIDDDNDGVFNDVDQCLNTIIGSVVNSNGCSLGQLVDIEPSDIKVIVSSATCPGKSNGIVDVSFIKDYVYSVSLIGGSENRVFNNVNYNTGLQILDIPEGAYEVCVTIPSVSSFKQCFNIVITVPESLKVNRVALNSNSLRYQVSGSKYYQITVNEKEYEYSYNDTSIQEIKVNLKNGTNTIKIKTKKPCQGTFKKKVMSKDIVMYPIPTNDYLNITGINENKVKITITNVVGVIALSRNVIVTNGMVRLPMETMSTGAYFVTVTTTSKTITIKILKN
ncbi:leucine-rich repeat domain-containing protein [Tenacibaculum ovolyticum]|uniref:leucine-rich repeat domain-containing protein n=1 Tax=Tenacibaculum ovolyticum TaxID=104270 RepID=UPI0007EDB351|nr:leucine-rich repeat domain-containing protein [Tenacibaculum ovolyticum]